MRRRESDVSCEFRGWWWWCKGDQQVAERGESSPTEVTKGLLRGVGDVAIETIQQGLPRGRDPISAAPAIVGIGPAHNESCALETRHQAREIGVARDHARADLGAGKSAPPRGAEDAQDVVLRRREAGGGGHRIGSFGRQPCRPDQRDQHLFFERITDRHGGGRCGHLHGGIITPREEYLSRAGYNAKGRAVLARPLTPKSGRRDLNSTASMRGRCFFWPLR